MPEAVVVAATRSPIGRANKGSLVDMRPDDLATQVVNSLMERAGVDKTEVEDLIMGCGQPAGESGFNIGRVVAVEAGMPDVPGVTVNRYCSSSLQTTRMAAHASWARTTDPSARTANARRAFLDRFERQVDPEGELPPDERARRADHARKAYFAGLALKSARARRKRRT